MRDMSTATQIGPRERIAAYTDRLDTIFRSAPSKHAAHERSAEVIAELAADPEFLTAALADHLAKPDSLSAQNYPVVGLTVESNPYYDLVVNCWIPLPSGETDVSTKAIHHHGELLLTTATMFGPGYEHWMLARPELIDESQSLYKMPLLGSGIHGLHELAFVDAYVAHVPLYPSSLTITVCLWSSRSQKTWRDSLKRVGFLKQRAAGLRRLAARAGLAKALELKVIDTFDFRPAEGGFVGMKERDEFPRGPNADHLRSLFHILQETGNAELGEIVERRLADGDVADPELVRELLQKLASGEPIEGRLSDGHYGVAHANFRRADIERALATQPA